MSNAEPIISVSGLRGIVGETLTPNVASRYVTSFAAELPSGPIVVTRDGRATGRMIADIVRSSLCAVGRDVIDGDVAATPTTGVLVRQHKAVGGVQISASHNPPPYNGLKLFGADGRVVPGEFGEGVLKRYRSDAESAWQPHDKIGAVTELSGTTSEHLRLVLETIDIERIKAKKFKVLLDSNHGAGSLLGRELLSALGCEATLLGDTPDGQFAHTPEPTAENLAGVSEHVRSAGAAVGFCQDPDADRLALIDESGKYVGEEYTVAICLKHILSQRQGTIVTNCSTSRMSQDIAKAASVDCLLCKVGEANVCDVMIKNNAIFGGEGNGGPIDPRVGYVRDSFVGMALVLDAMAAREMSLSGLAAELPRYEICKTKVTIDRDKIGATLEKLEAHFSDAKADRQDGLRLDWPGKWLLIRASNTEPIVRIIAEADSAEESQRLCDEAAKAIG